jgi:hypothetical protein
VVFVCVLIAACGRTSAVPIGREHYAPIPATQEVLVFTSDADVGSPFHVAALLTYDNPGKYRILTIENAIPDLQDQAREVGADALIIDQVAAVKSGIISTGIHVTARAIRLDR